jgi:integrase
MRSPRPASWTVLKSSLGKLQFQELEKPQLPFAQLFAAFNLSRISSSRKRSVKETIPVTPPPLSARSRGAVGGRLLPREDRDLSARLLPGVGADALGTAIVRACKASGVPVFSPHDLRHRRISLLHRQGRTWAEIARFVGQKKLSLTADTYTHVLSDGREVDLEALLS